MHFETGAMATKVQCFVLVAMYWALLASLMGNSPVSAEAAFIARIVVPEWAYDYRFLGNVTLFHYLPKLPGNNIITQRYVRLNEGRRSGYLLIGFPCPYDSNEFAIDISVYPPVGPDVLKYTCISRGIVQNINCGSVFEFQMYGTPQDFWCEMLILPH